MAAPLSSRLQTMLQAAVQSVQWTYSLFWQMCPQQGILVWGDGYYNGPIKTRKTVQPMEVSTEEASLQRSQQLRELYDSLSIGETNQPERRPCAALSPEDLTETEWFYLMCVSFSFAPGAGLPGKAYDRKQHVWLTGANDIDSKTFSRAILAKSAGVQTVVCIPLLDGVAEFGTTDKVKEDLGFIQHVKSFFSDHHHLPPPKPALSEHSTSNPATSSDHPRLYSPPIPPFYVSADPPANADQMNEDEEEEEEDDDDDDQDDEEDQESDSEAETSREALLEPCQAQNPLQVAVVEPSELMQLEMSEGIRLGSPDDGSNNLDLDFPLISPESLMDHQSRADSFRTESARRWAPMLQDNPFSGSLQPSASGSPPLVDLAQEDTHYSQTVTTILQNQPIELAAEPSLNAYEAYSTESAFAKWMNRSDHCLNVPVETTSQWLLKYILFTVPYLHSKYREENSPKSRDGDATNKFRKGTPQDELSANHVLAERRRREKLNERFIILRSLVPFVTKMDKASILGDTIEYVKQLLKKIQDLEACNKQMESEQRSRSVDPPQTITTSTSLKEQDYGVTVADRARSVGPGSDKRKMRIVEDYTTGRAQPKSVDSLPSPEPMVDVEPEISVEVSIIERDALIELRCGYREGLLLDIMQMLRELRIETIAVQSSSNNGIFVGELRAKVKENVSGKKLSIVEVKRAIRLIIPHD
ncbi:transcription factor BHLH42-like [Populus alba x Populus x berolinensis]|uniref:Transcription factor BHLH42-like n=1 Tax=Populus alba x Populus x berolinensis TaxID=444605 RepID=A0AAD6RDB8_9ROSI|nr:transcription factor BHLH42-like [Populus alba x Populus x berolinensis]